ncbi:MAG: outer membrane protein assembly factor BamB family protein [Patescibacteria group bacterium]
MLKNRNYYILVVVLFVLAVIGIDLHNANSTKVTKPQTTFFYKSYSQYSQNQKNNNVVGGVNNILISKVALAKNINGENFDTTPIVAGDAIYVGTMNKSNLSGGLLALSRVTGNVIWHDHFSNWIMTNPVVVPQINMVFVGSGNSIKYGPNHSYRGLGNNFVYGINISTGAVMWKYKTLGENMPTPIYSNGTLYFVNGNRTFYALSALTGKALWTLNVGSIVSMSSPILVGNNVFFGGSKPYKFFDVNINTKSIKWATSFKNLKGGVSITGGLDDTTPVYYKGYLYTNGTMLTNYSTNSGYEYLYKIDAQNGNIVWSVNEGYGIINEPTDPMEGSVPTLSGNTIYTGSNTARSVFAVNINTEKVDWSYKINGMINAPLTIIKEDVYAITGNGNIYVIDKNKGSFDAKRTLGGPEIASGLSFYSGKFYVTTGNGNFYILH